MLADVPLSFISRFYLQSGVFFTVKGTSNNQVLDTVESSVRLYSVKQNLQYVDMPLNLVMKLPLKGKTKFLLGGGLQASLFYSGNVSVTTVDEDGVYATTENKDLPVGKKNNQYATVHFGYNALVGFEFGQVFLTANFNQSLTPYYRQENQNYRFTTLGATLGIFLGKPAPATKRVENPDRDKDGVRNADDACPDIAGTVANKGCPLVDADADGIENKEDKCPTVKGVARYDGCPVPDTDKDGVNDEEDKCPNEIGLVKNQGCPEIDKAIVEKVSYAARQIQFEFRSDELTPSSLPVLNDIVQILKENPYLKIIVEGHTSNDGSAEANLKLSQNRAGRVKQYLVTQGVAESRITAVGYGSSRPLKPGDTEEEKAVNRRVEMKLQH